MIDLTVKTLDSQNHAFSLNDDITVKQFKDRIAEAINIPASTQRLIYCGRVLQNEKLLNEYDVNGKVIHLVQRAPPSVTQRSSNASESQGQSQTSGGEGGGWSQLPRIHYRQTQFHGNPMYVSSVSIPSDILGGREWLVRPNAPHSTGVPRHITVIRQMLNQANSIIDRLDNTATASEANFESTSSQADETPRETSDAETDGERSELPVSGVNIALARVHNDGTLEPILVSMNAAQSSQTDQRPQQQQPQDTSQQPTALNEDLNEQNESNDDLIPRVLAELLEKLLNTQERLNPYIRDQLLVIRNLPELVEDTALARENQQVFDRVTECLHCLSHAQHALSNLTVDMRQSSRVLRCRPMSINSPPMLQAGVPIQVEAHISLHGQNDNPNFEDNNSAPRTDTQSTEMPTSTNAETSTSRTTSSSQSQSASDQQNTNSTDSQLQPPSNSQIETLFNISNNVEVVMEMGSQFSRAWDFATNTQNRPSNSNNMNPSTNNNNNESGSNNNNTNSNSSTNTNTNRDSGEYQSWANSQSPDTIRNFVQVIAGYMAQHGLSTPIPVPSTSTPTTQGSVRRRRVAAAFAESPNSGQNSQTRGNTETHPTTSTQTRTTPRTHIFHQRAQARRAGLNQSRYSTFDPLLVCTSYHFRRNQTSPSSSTASTQTERANRSTSTQVSTQSQTGNTARVSGRCMNRDQLKEYISTNKSNLTENFSLACKISTPADPISLSWLLRQHKIFMESVDSSATTSKAMKILYMVADALFEIPVHDWENIVNEREYSNLVDKAFKKLCQNLLSLYHGQISTATPTLIADEICSVLKPHLKSAIDCSRFRRNVTVKKIEEILFKIIYKNIQSIFTYVLLVPKSTFTDCLEILNKCGRELVSVIRYFLKDLVLIISRFARSVSFKWKPALREWSLHVAGIWFYRYSLKVKLLSEYERNSLLSEIDNSESATTSSDCMASSESTTEPMEVDTTSNDQSANDPLLDGEEVPTTFPGHNNLLPDWVPIIARDGARQRRQLQLGLADSNSTTFSDAYLSTMPNKRRKLVEQQKPSLLVSPTPNHSLISASIERLVRESVERAGVEEVDGAIAALVAEPTVRRAFGLAIKESLVPGRFQTPDFPDPLRFPNATKFFANPSRSPK